MTRLGTRRTKSPMVPTWVSPYVSPCIICATARITTGGSCAVISQRATPLRPTSQPTTYRIGAAESVLIFGAATVRSIGGGCTGAVVSRRGAAGIGGGGAGVGRRGSGGAAGRASVVLPPNRLGRTIGISGSLSCAGQYGQRSHDSSMKCPFSQRLSATMPSLTRDRPPQLHCGPRNK